MIKTRAFQTSARAVFQPKGCRTSKSEMAKLPPSGQVPPGKASAQ